MDDPFQSANRVRGIPELSFENAEEFIETLHPHQKWWAPQRRELGDWIFRGQGDADWSLMPKAWRPNVLECQAHLYESLRPVAQARVKNIRNPPRISPNDNWDRNRLKVHLDTRVEIAAVREFVELADELGYPVPSPTLGEARDWEWAYRPERFDDSIDYIPSPAAFALAQHHGIPTRLLDFTRKPLVAAFFAAHQCAEERKAAAKCTENGKEKAESKALAVWAVNFRALPEDCRIHVVTCPRHQLSYLHAQDGVFLYDSEGNNMLLVENDWPPLDVTLAKQPGSELIRKLTLPARECDKLLQLLWKWRISLAHLMPTFDHVTKSLMTKWEWTTDIEQ